VDLGELVARLTLDTSKFTASASAANVSIAQMGRSLDAIGAKKVQGVIDAMNGSIMEANKRQTAFNAAVLKNVKAIEAARLQADAFREAQERLGLTAQEKLNTVSESFKKVTGAAGQLGITAGGAFGKMVDGAAGLAGAITGGGAIGVAGGLVGVFGLVAGAISVAKDRMEEFKRVSEEAAAAVDKQFATITALADDAAGGSRYKTMGSDDLDKERKRLGLMASGAAAASRNLLQQAAMERSQVQDAMRKLGMSEGSVAKATSSNVESLTLQAEELAQKAANLRKQMMEIRSTDNSNDGFFGAALKREGLKQEAANGAEAATEAAAAQAKLNEQTAAFLGLASGGTDAASQFNSEMAALNNALAFAGGPLTVLANATTLLGDAAASAAESMRQEADAFTRGPGTGDADAPAAWGSGDARWLAAALGGPLGAMGAVLPTDRFLAMADALEKSGKAATRTAEEHKALAGVLDRAVRSIVGGAGGAGLVDGQLGAGLLRELKSTGAAKSLVGQAGGFAGMTGSESMAAASSAAKAASSAAASMGSAMPIIGSLLQGLADRFTQVMGEAVDYVGKLFRGAFEAVSAPIQDVLGKAISGNSALGALGGGAQQGLAAGGTALSLALAPALAGLAGGPTTALVTLLYAPLVAPLVAAFVPLVAVSVGLGAGLMALSTQTKSYGQWQQALTRSTQPLVEAMEPLWRNLLPLTQQFLMMNRAVAAVIGALLPGQDAAVQLYEANRKLVLAVIEVAIGLGRAHNAINDVTRKFIEVHNTLDKMFNRGRDQKDAGGIQDTDLNALVAWRDSVAGASYAADMAAAELGNLSRAARESMNVPAIAKVNAARYAAMLEAEGGGSGPLRGDGAPAWRPDGGGRGDAGGIAVHGDVHIHGANVEDALRKLKRNDWQMKQTSPTDGWSPGRYANRG